MTQPAFAPEALEERKQKEIEWADFRRTIDAEDKEAFEKYNANKKYYAINRKVTDYIDAWLLANTVGKDVCELACGNTGMVRKVAHQVKSALAADIAPLTIEQAKASARGNPDWEKIDYRVLDCEKTGLPENSFDVMIEGGALHHMDVDAAYAEAARLLRPDGQFFCIEAIRHNPIIHLYRRLTPHLRTAWEVDHILGRSQVLQGLKYFHDIELRNFHLMTLFAVPFRSTKFFSPLMSVLEAIDSVLMKLPGVRWLAWQCVFVLKNPRK